MDDQFTILIADDDPDIRDLLGVGLRAPEYRLIFAENGSSAMEKIIEYTPDLILLDVMMPGMDGFEVCRAVRADPLLAEIPIIMVTAFADQESKVKGLDAGADDLIFKPFDRLEIRARVRTIIRLNRYRRLLLERMRFVWVVDNATEAYLTIDSSGGISYVNEAARTLFSLPAEEDGPIQGTFLEWAQKQYTLIPPGLWENWPHVSDPSLPLYLIRPQDDQSEAVWYHLHILDLPWGKEGKLLVRITEVSRSVTFAQEIWSFQSAISHKLNTPLSSILIASGLVKYHGEKFNIPDLIEYARAIEMEAKRLEGEITDIIEYVNVPFLARTGGEFPITEMAALVAQTAEDLGLGTVLFSIGDQELEQRSLSLSRRAMEIVFWELIENAKKFHPTLSPKVEVEIKTSASGQMLLRITDDGITLPPEQLAKAVIPYYQGEKTFTGEISGMGLGLPTVASMIWASGGSIHLYNRADEPGIIVEMEIPLKA